ncbi:hypothetical protein M9458_042803, partial [Cirrhinus mrigala]
MDRRERELERIEQEMDIREEELDTELDTSEEEMGAIQAHYELPAAAGASGVVDRSDGGT